MQSYILENYSLVNTVAAELFKDVSYPHEVLPHISDFIKELGASLPTELYDNPSENVWIAKSAKVAPTAYIGSPCIIDENAEVRHCAFIRGSAIIGKGAVVGNSTELKNVVLFDGVQVPHYNYVGDSVLGHRAHMGAGSITSNVKSDKTTVSVDYGNGRYDSGRKKIGAMLGDGVEVGCNSVLNPGTVIAADSRVYPLSSVRGYIPKNSIYKSRGEITAINSQRRI